MKKPQITMLAVVAMLLAGCGSGLDAASAIQRHCRLDGPMWSVGGDHGSVRFDGIVDMEWATDSTIAVAERSRIKIVATAGDDTVVAVLGREGEGPGEFRSIRTIAVGHDGRTIWAYDSELRRVSRIDASGQQDAVTTRLASRGGVNEISYPSVVHLAPDGRAVVEGETSATGLNVVANSDSALFRKYSLDGGGGEAVRWPRRARAVSETERDRRIEILLRAGGAQGREMARRFMRQAPMEAEAPQLAGIVVLANGEVWVADYEYLLELPTLWKVFRSAAHVGDIATPERFRVHSVRGSMVAGVWLDELDVEHVQVHRMSCQAGAGAT